MMLVLNATGEKLSRILSGNSNEMDRNPNRNALIYVSAWAAISGITVKLMLSSGLLQSQMDSALVPSLFSLRVLALQQATS
jgi:hypothetical protein